MHAPEPAKLARRPKHGFMQASDQLQARACCMGHTQKPLHAAKPEPMNTACSRARVPSVQCHAAVRRTLPSRDIFFRSTGGSSTVLEPMLTVGTVMSLVPMVGVLMVGALMLLDENLLVRKLRMAP